VGLKLLLKKNKGFSLLEVIIGVAILSTGIVIVLQALAFCARVTGVSCNTVRAVFLAEDKWQEAGYKVKKGIITEASPASGQEDNFKWSYELSKFEEYPDLYKFDLNVNWTSGNREEKLELNSWLSKE